jgi:hypothetical protein
MPESYVRPLLTSRGGVASPAIEIELRREHVHDPRILEGRDEPCDVVVCPIDPPPISRRQLDDPVRTRAGLVQVRWPIDAAIERTGDSALRGTSLRAVRAIISPESLT